MEDLKKPKKTASIRVVKLLSHLEKYGIPTVAERLGVGASKIYNWKYGNKPNFDALELIADEIPNIDWNEIMYDGKNGELLSSYIKESELERKLKEANEELEKARIELNEVKHEKRKLFDLLGKHEGMTESLLFDTKYGSNLMYALLGSKVGHALANRMQ